MSRVKKMRLITGSGEGVDRPEYRTGIFILQTDRRYWHVELTHQGNGVPYCFYGRCKNDAGRKRRHSPIDCSQYWCKVAVMEADIANELHDEL